MLFGLYSLYIFGLSDNELIVLLLVVLNLINLWEVDISKNGEKLFIVLLCIFELNVICFRENLFCCLYCLD